MAPVATNVTEAVREFTSKYGVSTDQLPFPFWVIG
jgi:hypothetical protein